jgi:hypothetical protein
MITSKKILITGGAGSRYIFSQEAGEKTLELTCDLDVISSEKMRLLSFFSIEK